jgi:hypothetical protein
MILGLPNNYLDFIILMIIFSFIEPIFLEKAFSKNSEELCSFYDN